jgi:hypothetical protein
MTYDDGHGNVVAITAALLCALENCTGIETVIPSCTNTYTGDIGQGIRSGYGDVSNWGLLLRFAGVGLTQTGYDGEAEVGGGGLYRDLVNTMHRNGIRLGKFGRGLDPRRGDCDCWRRHWRGWGRLKGKNKGGSCAVEVGGVLEGDVLVYEASLGLGSSGKNLFAAVGACCGSIELGDKDKGKAGRAGLGLGSVLLDGVSVDDGLKVVRHGRAV